MAATKSIVEDYLVGLLPHVRMERLEEGGFVATVPEAPGVIADGDTPLECITDLYERLERWVKGWSAKGCELPAVAGIDLNTPENRTLASYHDGGEAAAPSGLVFDSDEAFLEHLADE